FVDDVERGGGARDRAGGVGGNHGVGAGVGCARGIQDEGRAGRTGDSVCAAAPLIGEAAAGNVGAEDDGAAGGDGLGWRLPGDGDGSAGDVDGEIERAHGEAAQPAELIGLHRDRVRTGLRRRTGENGRRHRVATTTGGVRIVRIAAGSPATGGVEYARAGKIG